MSFLKSFYSIPAVGFLDPMCWLDRSAAFETLKDPILLNVVDEFAVGRPTKKVF